MYGFLPNMGVTKFRRRIADELEEQRGEHGGNAASFLLVAFVAPWVGVADVDLIESPPTWGPVAHLDKGPEENPVVALGLVGHQGPHPWGKIFWKKSPMD
jgi:hypothetical protein